MISVTELRNGTKVEMDGGLWECLEYSHLKMGRAGAKEVTKFRNMETDFIVDRTFSSGEKLQDIYVEGKKMQFLYKDGDMFHFMNTGTYEQIQLTAEVLGDSALYLLPESLIMVEFYEEKPMGIHPPQTVDLKVVETVPGIKGATAAAQVKPATCETGLVVIVPAFVNEGDVIRINTEDGEYLSRV